MINADTPDEARSLLPVLRRYDLIDTEHDYPRWSGPPIRTIAICTHPRSGSTLLGEALYFAGGLGCPLEYFYPAFRAPFEARWQTRDSHDYIGAVHQWRTDPGGTLGVKLFWGDMERLATALAPGRFDALHAARPQDVSSQTYRDIAATLAPVLPDCRYVHLVRRDRVRRAVSATIARQTGVWRAVHGRAPPPADSLRFDYDAIDMRIALADRNHAHWCNFFAAIGAEPLRLDYEAMAADFAGSVRPLLTALGRDVPVPLIRLARQTGGDGERMVRQFLRERRRRATMAPDS